MKKIFLINNKNINTNTNKTSVKKNNIIVIGNGPSVLKHEFGNIIDNFDEVVRINHYVPSKNVGKKLTIFAHSTYGTIIYNNVFSMAKEILVWNQTNSKEFKSYKSVKNTIIDKKPIETILKKNFNFNIYPQGPWCSTGVAILMYLINKYEKICIHGFDYLQKSKQLHYFESKIIKTSEHSSILEKKFIEHYLKLGKLYKLEDLENNQD